MKMLEALSDVQRNVLIASIIADGEITKCYPGTRRKNNSYREHYGHAQEAYRYWKQSVIPDILYITPKSQTLRSASLPLFTELYPYFYDDGGSKKIPVDLLTYCAHPLFLAILYMDDGSLSISKRINHNKKLIYLTPHIFLYLQNYPKEQLEQLQRHISQQFLLDFSINKRKDGHGYILRFTSVEKTFQFLNTIEPYVKSCNGMEYKLDWEWRLQHETEILSKIYPQYEVRTSSHERFKNYNDEEISMIILMLQQKKTQQSIADTLGRSYWSVVYKISELRKNKLL